MMSENSRHALLASFDSSRSAFLASIDQIVAELRPVLLMMPGFYDDSVLACAGSFASRELVRSQLEEISPSLLDEVSEGDLAEAHLVTVAYLFSLMLHEAMRNDSPLPEITTEEIADA